MNLIKGLKYQRLAILMSLVILILCFMKMPQSTGKSKFFFVGFDKMVHLGLFYMFTVFLLYGRNSALQTYRFSWVTIGKVLAIVILFGGAIELIQWRFFTSRSAEWWDFASDLFGALMGVFGYAVLHFKHYNEKV